MVERSYDYNPLRKASEEERKRQTEKLARHMERKSRDVDEVIFSEEMLEKLDHSQLDEYFEKRFSGISQDRIREEIETKKTELEKLKKELLYTPGSVMVTMETGEGEKKKKDKIPKVEILSKEIQSIESKIAKLQEQAEHIKKYSDVHERSIKKTESVLSEKYQSESEKYRTAERELNAGVDRKIAQEADPELLKTKIGEKNLHDILQNIIGQYVEESKNPSFFGKIFGSALSKQKQEKLQKLEKDFKDLEKATGLSKEQLQEIKEMVVRQIDLEVQEFSDDLDKLSAEVEAEKYQERKTGTAGAIWKGMKKATPTVLFYGAVGMASAAILPAAWMAMATPLGIRALRAHGAFKEKQGERLDMRMKFARGYIDNKKKYERFEEVFLRNLSEKRAEQLRAERVSPKDLEVAVEYRGLQEKEQDVIQALHEAGIMGSGSEKSILQLIEQGKREQAKDLVSSMPVDIEKQTNSLDYHMNLFPFNSDERKNLIETLSDGYISYEDFKEALDSAPGIDKKSRSYQQVLECAQYIAKEAERKQPDNYQKLGVARDATPEEIQKAYETKLATLKPDHPLFMQRRDELIDMRNTLKDPARREAYNRKREALQPTFRLDTLGGQNITRLMDELQSQQRRVEDVRDDPATTEARKHIESVLEGKKVKRNPEVKAGDIAELEKLAQSGDFTRIEQRLDRLHLTPEKKEEYKTFYRKIYERGQNGLLETRLQTKCNLTKNENERRLQRASFPTRLFDELHTLARTDDLEGAAELLEANTLDHIQEWENIKQVCRDMVPIGFDETIIDDVRDSGDWETVREYFESQGVDTRNNPDFNILMERMERLYTFDHKPERTYYDVLGIGRNATEKEIRASYKRLSAENYPPKDDAQAALLEQIQEAYGVLSQDKKRDQYDEQLRPYFELFIDPKSLQGQEIMSSLTKIRDYQREFQNLQNEQKSFKKEQDRISRELQKAMDMREKCPKSLIDNIIIMARNGNAFEVEAKLHNFGLDEKTTRDLRSYLDILYEIQRNKEPIQPEKLIVEADFMDAKANYIEAITDLRSQKEEVEAYEAQCSEIREQSENRKKELVEKLQKMGFGRHALNQFEELARLGRIRHPRPEKFPGKDIPPESSIEGILRNNPFSKKQIEDTFEVWKKDPRTNQRRGLDVEATKAILEESFGKGALAVMDKLIQPDPASGGRPRVNVAEVQKLHRSFGYFGTNGIKAHFEVRNVDGHIDEQATRERLQEFFGREISGEILYVDPMRGEIMLDYRHWMKLFIESVVEGYSPPTLPEAPAILQTAQKVTQRFEQALDTKAGFFSEKLEAVSFRQHVEKRQKESQERLGKIELQRQKLPAGQELDPDILKEKHRLKRESDELKSLLADMDKAAKNKTLSTEMPLFYERFKQHVIAPDLIQTFQEQKRNNDIHAAEAKTRFDEADQKAREVQTGINDGAWYTIDETVIETARTSGFPKKKLRALEQLQNQPFTKNELIGRLMGTRMLSRQEIDQILDQSINSWVKEEFLNFSAASEKVEEFQKKIDEVQKKIDAEEEKYQKARGKIQPQLDQLTANQNEAQAKFPELKHEYEEALKKGEQGEMNVAKFHLDEIEETIEKNEKKLEELKEKIENATADRDRLKEQHQKEIEAIEREKTAAERVLETARREYVAVYQDLHESVNSEMAIAQEDRDRTAEEKQRLDRLSNSLPAIQKEARQKLAELQENFKRQTEATLALYKSEQRNQLYHDTLEYGLVEKGISAPGGYARLKEVYQQTQNMEGRFVASHDIRSPGEMLPGGIGRAVTSRIPKFLQFPSLWQEEQKYRSSMAMMMVSGLGILSREMFGMSAAPALAFVGGTKFAEGYAERKSAEAAYERARMKAESKKSKDATGKKKELSKKLAYYERTYGKVPDFEDINQSLETWRENLLLADVEREKRGEERLGLGDVRFSELSNLLARTEELIKIYRLQGGREYNIKTLREKTRFLERTLSFENNLLLTESFNSLQADSLIQNMGEFYQSEKQFQKRKRGLKWRAGIIAGAAAAIPGVIHVHHAVTEEILTRPTFVHPQAIPDKETWPYTSEGVEGEPPIKFEPEEARPDVLEEQVAPVKPEEITPNNIKEETGPEGTEPVIKIEPDETPPEQIIEEKVPPKLRVKAQPGSSEGMVGKERTFPSYGEPSRETRRGVETLAQELEKAELKNIRSQSLGQTEIPKTAAEIRVASTGDLSSMGAAHEEGVEAKGWEGEREPEEPSEPLPDEREVELEPQEQPVEEVEPEQEVPETVQEPIPGSEVEREPGHGQETGTQNKGEPSFDSATGKGAVVPETPAEPERGYPPFTLEEQKDDSMTAVDKRMERYIALAKEGKIPADKARFGNNLQLKEVNFGGERLVFSYKGDTTTVELQNTEGGAKIGETVLDKNGHVTEERFFSKYSEEIHRPLPDGGEDRQEFAIKGKEKIPVSHLKLNKEGLSTHREYYDSDGHLQSLSESHYENGRTVWEGKYSKDRMLERYSRFGYDKEGRLATVSAYDRKDNPIVWDKVEAYLAGKGHEPKMLETRLEVYDPNDNVQPNETGLVRPLYSVEGEYNRNMLLNRDNRVDREIVTWRSGHQTVREFSYEGKDAHPDEIEETLKNQKGDVIGKREVVLAEDGRTPSKYTEYKIEGDKEVKVNEHTYEVGPNGQRFREYENTYDAEGKRIVRREETIYDRDGNLQSKIVSAVDSKGKGHEMSRTTYGTDEKDHRYQAEYRFETVGDEARVQEVRVTPLDEKGVPSGEPRTLKTVGEMRQFLDREDLYQNGRLVIDREAGQYSLQYGYDSKGRVDEMNVLDPRTGKPITHWEVERERKTGEIEKYIRTDYTNNGRTQVISEFDRNGVGNYGYTQVQSESGTWQTDSRTRWDAKHHSEPLPKLEGQKFHRYKPLMGPSDRML